MDLGAFLKTVDQIITERKLEMKSISLSIGQNETYVRDLLRGKSKKPGIEGLVALAVALDLDPAESLGIPRTKPKVPVVGYVGAGAEILPIDDFPKGQGIDEVPCPSGLNPARTVAVIVRGSSMAPSIPEGWRVFYSRDPEQDTAGVVGKLCVVKVNEGPTLLKQVRKGSRKGRFHLISTSADLLEDQRLDWASPVRAMQAPE